MFNEKFILLIGLLIIIIIFIIWFIFFKLINNNNKIEKFESASSILDKSYTNLLSNKFSSIQRNEITSCNTLFYKYYRIFEIIQTDSDYAYNIYYSYDVNNLSNTETISNRIFINNTSLNTISFIKPQPLPDINCNTNTTLLSTTTSNTILNSNYIVIDFINKSFADTKFKINKISICLSNSINNGKNIINIGDIQFFNSIDTAKTSDPYNMGLNSIKYYNTNIQSINTNLSIFTYYFSNLENEPPSLDDITINFSTATEQLNLAYINIYGMPEIEYKCIINKMYNIGDSSTLKFEGSETASTPASSTKQDDDKCYINNIINYDNQTLALAFRKIIQNNIPWGIYNGANITSFTDGNGNMSIFLPDLLGRNCRNAKINDTTNKIKYVSSLISNDPCNYQGYNQNNRVLETPIISKIDHLKADSSINIEFPVGSLPYNYTICAITRFTDISSRGRIITAKNCCSPMNFALGHLGGYSQVSYNMGFRSDEKKNGDTNWVVSCFKSQGGLNTIQKNNRFNTVMFNGKALGLSSFSGNGYNYADESVRNNPNNILTVNGLISETSSFGLSYLIIWDKILTDVELEIVSKNLINVVMDNSYKLPLSQLIIRKKGDGLTPDTAPNDAISIINNNCNSIISDGYYWIKILESQQRIYCILNKNIGIYGGGWMLAMKGAKNSDTFKFNSNYWTTNNKYNENYNDVNILNNTTSEIKTDIFNYFKFSEILIIYNDQRFANNPYFKRSYYKLNNPQIRGKYSLSEFFGNNLNDFNYCNINNGLNLNLNDALAGFKSISANGCIDIGKKMGIDYNKFLNIYLSDPNGFNYTNDTFSQQSVCCAYGMNLNFSGWPWGQLKARIGAIFNENSNSWFESIDVCGGIGLNGDVWYASGDYIGCCESSKGINSSLPFLLFVR